jgi:hypothetical protein|tara:strand:+ start:2843 stop:2983 length:141 start_codon:yes stop_codon:yes gene_type:complete
MENIMGKQPNLKPYMGSIPHKTSSGPKGHGAVMAGKAIKKKSAKKR